VRATLSRVAGKLSRRMRPGSFERSPDASRAIILMFHQIFENDDSYLREIKAGCTIAFLESIVLQLRRSQWNIVTLDDALTRIADHPPSQRFAVLTFDDGYRDTLQLALPILERHQAPFTIYVPTGAVTRELDAWWLGVRALFQRHDEVVVSAMGRTFECADMTAKVAACSQVQQWVHQNYTRAAKLGETFRSYKISLRDLNESYFLGPSDLCSLARHPLVTVGAHSTSHMALSALDADAARHELVENRDYLERLLNKPVGHLAYPYGNSRACGEREFALAKMLAFRSAVTASHKPMFAFHRQAPHCLPRVGVSGTLGHFKYFLATLREFERAVVPEYSSLDS
jgi:peptidoglycan/xylan/chitin deacetylase (PgdA/CDA1 family)